MANLPKDSEGAGVEDELSFLIAGDEDACVLSEEPEREEEASDEETPEGEETSEEGETLPRARGEKDAKFIGGRPAMDVLSEWMAEAPELLEMLDKAHKMEEEEEDEEDRGES